MLDLSIVPMSEHVDSYAKHPAQMVTWEAAGKAERVQIMSKMEGKGCFLKIRYRGQDYASQGYLPSLAHARNRVKAFFHLVQEEAVHV